MSEGGTKFEQDMMEFILNELVDNSSDVVYFGVNNISITYSTMEAFKAKIKKHPFIFRLFFKIM